MNLIELEPTNMLHRMETSKNGDGNQMKATYPTLFNILGIALEMVLLGILK
jgi:hypothetical protein